MWSKPSDNSVFSICRVLKSSAIWKNRGLVDEVRKKFDEDPDPLNIPKLA